jgi:hypothetical protein
MELHDIDAALAEIQDALENEHAALEAQLQEALTNRTYDVLKQLTPRIETIEAFRGRVMTLHTDWQKTFAKKRRSGERLGRGLRTPQEAFFRPILEALVARGGSARKSDIVSDLEARMGAQLTEHDRVAVPSNPNELRWQNTVAWARHDLRLAGRIKDDSAQGIWEISEAGREWLGTTEATKE